MLESLLLASCKGSIVGAVIHTCYIPAVVPECTPQDKDFFHTSRNIINQDCVSIMVAVPDVEAIEMQLQVTPPAGLTGPVDEDMQTPAVHMPEARHIISRD